MSRGDEGYWTLVYKIATGGNEKAYDLFMSDNPLNENDFEAMSCSENHAKKHFKSSIVNKWSTIGIDQVRVSLYVSGMEKAFLLFKGSETTKSNWFKKNRLIDSSYIDLNDDKGVYYFSMEGVSGPADNFDDGKFSRRFYIRKEKDGNCHNSDYGWLLVGDEIGNCKYERRTNEIPFILFSNPPNISKAKDHILADSMAIFVKFSFKEACLSPFAMKCVQPTTTMGNEDPQNQLDQIITDIRIHRKSTQKYKRTLTSAPDERTSSKIMGIIGGTVIISVFGFIVLLDCTTCNRKGKVTQKKAIT
ncbi:unnamed protein product [Mytilus coruscus]|uniref:Uncharacterized protein n=1 Tax=Mytilus coruscus TaxID=42192 RepID=A0A6J8C6R2_MYTCO|nr:unnamed protein product [Mytilus coruscus]